MTLAQQTVESGIRDLVDQQIADGRQIGIQVSVYHHAEPVVDIAAGVMGPGDPRPVEPDSLFCAFSVTKGVAALAVHILAERGQIDYDAPVVAYWPEFAANGKERLTVAQALSHQSGLHAMPEPFEPEHITDWDAGIRRMEQGVPAWEPGTATGYHAVTFGWIVGGIVQGATGRHIKDVIREEIAEPLGVADEMYVGIPSGIEDRLTTLEIATIGEGAPVPPDHDMFKAMPNAMWPHFNQMAFRQACLPSGNGHFSARALGKMYAALANGGEIDGVRLVPASRIAHMQRLMTDDIDRVLMGPVPKGIGFMFGGSNAVPDPMGPRRSAFGHPGAGGSVAFCDPEADLAVAICINKMQYPGPGEGPTLEICEQVRALLGAS
jgi:CubicO group peptidase (beta-lactamase class C family)